MTFNPTTRDALAVLYGALRAPSTTQTKAPVTAGAQEVHEMSKPMVPHAEACDLVRAIAARAHNGVVTIAPGVAGRILTELNWEGQRRITPKRQAEPRAWLELGTWRAHRCVFTFAELPSGQLILIDGQTRLYVAHALQRAIQGRIEFEPAADLHDVGLLYATFDLPASARSSIDQLCGEHAPEAMHVKRDTARAVLGAMPIIRNGLNPTAPNTNPDTRSHARCMAEMATWAREARAFEAVVTAADPFVKRKLKTAGVCAVALYTMRFAPAKASEFWGALASNNGLARRDPRARLLADFASRQANAGSARQNVQRVVTAWNAFMEGRELRIIKCIDGAPIRVAGTPLARN